MVRRSTLLVRGIASCGTASGNKTIITSNRTTQDGIHVPPGIRDQTRGSLSWNIRVDQVAHIEGSAE